MYPAFQCCNPGWLSRTPHPVFPSRIWIRNKYLCIFNPKNFYSAFAILDGYLGSRIRFFHPWSESATNNKVFLTQKIFTEHSEIWSVMFIPDLDPRSWFLPSQIPDLDPGSGSRIQGSKSTGSRIRMKIIGKQAKMSRRMTKSVPSWEGDQNGISSYRLCQRLRKWARGTASHTPGNEQKKGLKGKIGTKGL